jgi:hypothetical protein
MSAFLKNRRLIFAVVRGNSTISRDSSPILARKKIVRIFVAVRGVSPEFAVRARLRMLLLVFFERLLIEEPQWKGVSISSRGFREHGRCTI